ncbi:hypothetical protein SEVIR_5G474100v4 [Setaria viridis]|uniref:Coenzyme Q-binding protein COQ10 START domain-containing protein n=1 Tax=Setaria viridis TaxID=4556 RepID=A0A4U6UWI4_SETVI|nr:uncharacterized protein LOC117855234 [Setaria viridis]TKW19073.1 hypothetical protein SEVIR_5G474100v2 [Setaria viridis]
MATCCCASSSHGRLLTFSSSSRSPARLRLICPSAPLRLRLSSSSSSSSSRAPHPQRLSCSSSQEPAPVDVADDDCSAADQRIGFEIQVSKIGKRNRRLVRARVRVDAPLEAVWATLTDYEGLADFIPGLSECRLLDQAQGFARLYQVGEQDLALGFKFNAKGTIDCYEGDLESLPDAQGNARRREIAFNMIDGDFKVFQGKWSVQESVEQEQGGGDSDEGQESQTTTLSYLVELEPKLWVPVRLLEGRICSEIKNNLVSIREQAQRRIINTSDH